ncbi:hypothetical protein [Paraburkholderia bengalensis]
MNPLPQKMCAALAAIALVLGMSACKKVDEKSSNSMDAGSSGVMSNTSGMSGTPGQSAAAKTASESAPAASGAAATSVAPAAATPASMASGVPSGASQ